MEAVRRPPIDDMALPVGRKARIALEAGAPGPIFGRGV
jgi:hypothetical protein